MPILSSFLNYRFSPLCLCYLDEDIYQPTTKAVKVTLLYSLKGKEVVAKSIYHITMLGLWWFKEEGLDDWWYSEQYQ